MMPEIIYLPEISSTNTYLKELENKRELAEGTAVYTDFQTAGRGQKGNTWESERGKNLSFSIIIHPTHVEITKQFIISQLISLAIKEVLEEYTSDVSIKWPNDIYCGNKKMVGILIENELTEEGIANSILGVGININQVQFLSDAPNPISLKQLTKIEHDRLEILKKIQTLFVSLYNNSTSSEISLAYKNALYRKSGFHKYATIDGDLFSAKIKDVEDEGFLVLELASGEKRSFAFKEVKYIL